MLWQRRYLNIVTWREYIPPVSVVNKTYVFSFAFINPKLKTILALWFRHFTEMGRNRQYRRTVVSGSWERKDEGASMCD